MILDRPSRAFVIAFGLAAACGRDRPSEPAESPLATEARAQAALGPFKKSLQSALMGAMGDGGPEGAIEVCATEAPRLAALASRDGVRVGRAALRRRNPENLPPAWATPALEELARSPADGAHRIVPLPGGRVGYVEAILTKPVCLTCHGESVAPALRARIATRYPHDEATGFREGDLRGVFWAELPSPTTR
ncbi:MAG: DUF3365 domain-containing protein [Deltaproteobacteria bacterium]|nr:DUF3365 domain-containing protein [Deltaproteobacteria bacterium]